MRALIVYESMYGNTHTVADHVAEGLAGAFETVVTTAAGATAPALADADLVVVGGPTHAHGMTSSTTRRSAAEAAAKDDDLEMDADGEGPGLRDWFGDLPAHLGGAAAAFDTRIDASPVLTGRASKGIARRLRHHGFDLLLEPESFLVDKQNHLVEGEAERARQWGADLVAAFDRAYSS